ASIQSVVDNGGSEWLRLAVLVFAWNGLKFVLAGPGLVLMRLTSNRRNRPRAHGQEHLRQVRRERFVDEIWVFVSLPVWPIARDVLRPSPHCFRATWRQGNGAPHEGRGAAWDRSSPDRSNG